MNRSNEEKLRELEAKFYNRYRHDNYINRCASWQDYIDALYRACIISDKDLELLRFPFKEVTP